MWQLNVAITFSVGITLINVYLSWLNWFHFLILEGGLLIILIDCLIFLSPFLDVTKMSVSAVSFLAQLDSWLWNSLPIECFPLTYGLSGFKSRINRHLLTVGFFKTDFLYALIFLSFFFLYFEAFVVAVQSCIEWVPI